MWRSLQQIINKRLKSLSTIIQRSKPPGNTLRILCFLYIIFVTSQNAQGGDVIPPRVHSWRRRYNQGPESLYLGHSGNPWSTSATATNLRDYHMGSFLGEMRNDSKTAEAAMTTGISSSPRRSKRGVMHLYNMVVCATGCNPLAYKGYGCYCGFLGSGFTIDGIDRCCKMHDWCYEATDCPMFLEYFVPYYWKCYRGNKPICAVEHGDWGGSGSCAQRLCECDRALAECLRRYPCPTTKAVCTSSPWRLVQNLFMLM